MSTFETETPRTGRWVRQDRIIVLPDPWLPGDDSSVQEMGTTSTTDVAWVQRSLNQVMGSGLVADGVLGPYTRAAVVAFQQRTGLTADGIPGPITKAALQAALVGAPSGAYPGGAPAGVSNFEGKPCANWLIPYLRWAREHGWQGRLTSGWRDPAYSEKLCRDMCDAPTCPGRCAGRFSHHSGDVKPKGAVDVTDERRFGELMAQCPLSPRIFNDLPNDRIHFSASGR
ncbi:MAG: peptidoglycan-binding domain-containing protein [Pseudonocardiaceae bacterium]